ncbi:nitroreductase [Pueribacillus theae]|uniref:Putative NAD(P)H nitroreductase n=1 Tax=Pueribacillus theae TaxID=2171751 RepID=A0A2U1JXZ6_9BACI|nr:nitroreductase [Pueribacillus theae]PWA10090.1 nitroreductase [Pueribacillus theae]
MNETIQSISKVIRDRRSIKKGYLPTEVSEDVIVSLLNDAVWAPNHKLREPWRFIFVSNDRKEAFIKSILACYSHDQHEQMRKKFADVPAFLVAIMKIDPRQKQWDENFAATSCLIQNLQLLAWEKDIGMVWKTPQHIYDPKFYDGLGVEKDEKIIGIIQIGYFDKSVKAPPRNRTDAKEKLTLF